MRPPRRCARVSATQVAGTYFNNDNATSVAMDVFKGVLDEAGKASTDKDLEEYGGLNDEEFLCEYVTKEADSGAPLPRARSRAAMRRRYAAWQALPWRIPCAELAAA